MKRFQFPLERVLRYRQLQAEAQQALLERGLAGLARIDDRMDLLEQEGARTEEAVRRALAAECVVEAEQLVTYPDYRSVLARGRRGLLEERRRALDEIARQRAVVAEARRACEILARGRARSLEQWQAAFARELEATAAELFLSKWKKPERKVNRPAR